MDDVSATYAFRVHYYDTQSDLTKELLLLYYAEDNTVELYDRKSRRLFLKRYGAPPFLERQLYVNNTIQLLSRQLKIVDYGDERTRRQFFLKKIEKIRLRVQPHAYNHLGDILQRLLDADLTLSHIQMSRSHRCNVSQDRTAKLCEGGSSILRGDGSPDTACILPLMDIEVVGRDADARVSAVVGPSDPAIARQEMPTSLRGLYGVSRQENVVCILGRDEHSPKSENEIPTGAAEQVYNRHTSCATCGPTDCSCCIIKPSGLKHAGSIIRDIQNAGFELVGLQSFHLTKNAADEFYEVYQHVLKEQPQMVEELTSGMCIAMWIEHPEKHTVKRLRELTGPFDSEMARTLRPASLRAKYGIDAARNAVHCTDLPEDGEMEVHFFFQVLAEASERACSHV